MNAGFYTGVSGMIAFQREMDVVANNISNINTTGFKPSSTSFEDILYTKMDTNGTPGTMTGHGVRTDSTKQSMEAGLYNQTQQDLDFAIQGEGFFAVERGKNDRVYTRNGSFKIGMVKTKAYLTTAEGDYVLNQSGKKIEIKLKEDSNLPELSEIKDQIGIYTFSNPYGLEATENASFIATDLSGKAQAPKTSSSKKTTDLPYSLISGSLENSAVDLSKEMVNVIQSQRAFQLNAKVVQVADQIEEIINNLR